MQILLTAIPLSVLPVFYCVWLFTKTPIYLESVFAGTLLLALVSVLYVKFIAQCMSFFVPESPVSVVGREGLRSNRRSGVREILVLLTAIFVFRVLMIILCYYIYYRQNGYACTFFSAQRMFGSQLDARHYMAIAEHGYVTSTANGANLTLVFLPLYSYLTKIAAAFSGNYVRAGFFVNHIAAIMGCLMLYLLVKIDFDRKTARRAVKYFCILPAACLLYANMSDSLFFALSVTSLYFMRKRRFPLAALAAGFACYTRLIGVTLLVPLIMEYAKMLSDARIDPKIHEKHYYLKTALTGCSILIVPLFVGIYLLQNYLLWGNWFQFLVYQKENWYQTFSWFFQTAGYQTDYLIGGIVSGTTSTVLGTWIPNLVYIFASVSVLLLSCKRMRASYVAYFGAYFLMAVSVSWLLSAPRYLTCCFPLILGLALLTRRKAVDIPLTLVSLAGFVIYLMGLVSGYPIY
ncbi:MAG: glycosyltransferase family 39 protein [Clostridia bacterium]|nr:glycosyltransferase family 39 protein [Clostridia bacterium]